MAARAKGSEEGENRNDNKVEELKERISGEEHTTQMLKEEIKAGEARLREKQV